MKEEEEKEKHAGGRPLMFESSEDLDVKINDYFTNCPDKRGVWNGESNDEIAVMTITGLALFLGFCSRQSMYDYEKKSEFSYSIKKARLSIENIYEQNIQLGIGTTGAIFALKNFGWRDKIDTVNTTVDITDELSKEEKEKAVKRVTEGLIEFNDYK